MKRDMDLIRSILLWIESQPEGHNTGWELSVPGYSADEVSYHVHLMGQAGLLVVEPSTSIGSKVPAAIPVSITWDRCDFLAATKDDTVWAKARAKVIAPAGGVAFKLLLEWLMAEGKARLGLPR
jgi:hypothetical protein